MESQETNVRSGIVFYKGKIATGKGCSENIFILNGY